MKKISLFCATAALVSLALSASALPTGYESVNFHATVKVQDGAKIEKVSLDDKDLLNNFIGTEFATSIPNGAKLVSYGLGSEEFAVLNKDNDIFLEDASTNPSAADHYSFYIYSGWRETVYEETSTNVYKGETANAELYYMDGSGDYYLEATGSGSATVHYINGDFDYGNESYSGSGEGYCFLPSGDLKGYGNRGILKDSISGSGKEVEPFFLYFVL
jgi:hypothetical protein